MITGTQFLGLLRWHSGKESACQCRRHRRCGFDPWIGKISWRRKWQLTPVFLPGKSHGQRSLASYSPQGRQQSDTTEQRSTHAHVSVCVSIYTALYRKSSTEVQSPIGSTFRIEKVFRDCWGEKRTKNMGVQLLRLDYL